MKSGFVAIIGRPNVGKSTLINAILKRKISIVTCKSQTTRNAIQGILNLPDVQIVFVDTPGIHKPNNELGKVMNKNATDSCQDVEAIVLVVDASQIFGVGDEYIVSKVPNNVPLFIVFNKIDLTNIAFAESIKAKYKELLPQGVQMDICATESFNVKHLVDEIIKVLPEGPEYYPEDMISNKPLSFMVAEIIREKALILLKEEVPHALAVSVEKIDDTKKGVLVIDASLIVEKPGQKAIVIGKGGHQIKQIGTFAREDIAKLTHKTISLTLFVKVKEGWREEAKLLKTLGIQD